MRRARTQLVAVSVLVSVTDIAHAFGRSRETVARRLADLRVPAAGKRRGGPVYSLRDAVRAMLEADAERDPFRRKADLQAEAIALQLSVKRGELIHVDDVREAYAAALKPVRLALETLPDMLERDAGLTPAQVARAERAIDEARDRLHADVLKVARVRAGS